MLPSWLTKNENGSFDIDTDVAYPIAFKALEPAAVEKDQFGLEAVYQLTKIVAQEAVEFNGLIPENGTVRLFTRTADKDQWRIASYPKGRGADAATTGGASKMFLPMVRKALLAG